MLNVHVGHSNALRSIHGQIISLTRWNTKSTFYDGDLVPLRLN